MISPVPTRHPRVAQRLTDVLPGWAAHSPSAATPRDRRYVLGVLPGEGIGPEVTAATVAVLRAVAVHQDLDLDIRVGHAIGIAAQQACGQPLSPQVIGFCESVFADGGAILCGAGGGRFVYDLRARFDLFCKFTPVQPIPALADAGVLRPRAVAGVDLIVVRENVGGLYFGRGHRAANGAGDEVSHTFHYRARDVRRIVEAAVGVARRRRGRLALAVKSAAVPAVSALWCEIFEELTAGAGVASSVLEADNAGYQILAAARSLDVVVTPNMIGDMLSDSAAVLLGSRGLSYSGNFGAPGIAVYQTGHGAAHDLAGSDAANPLGQILSAAFMLRESFGLFDAAAAIETAIERTLGARIRTADIAGRGARVVGTHEMARLIAAQLAPGCGG